MIMVFLLCAAGVETATMTVTTAATTVMLLSSPFSSTTKTTETTTATPLSSPFSSVTVKPARRR
ncbi:MAG: hypothetical protein MPL62_00625 [Alphaproteobacteria bacterium]|nr:hypothetical protein [Alphaproteobacteria bacterium]